MIRSFAPFSTQTQTPPVPASKVKQSKPTTNTTNATEKPTPEKTKKPKATEQYSNDVGKCNHFMFLFLWFIGDTPKPRKAKSSEESKDQPPTVPKGAKPKPEKKEKEAKPEKEPKPEPPPSATVIKRRMNFLQNEIERYFPCLIARAYTFDIQI